MKLNYNRFFSTLLKMRNEKISKNKKHYSQNLLSAQNEVLRKSKSARASNIMRMIKDLPSKCILLCINTNR